MTSDAGPFSDDHAYDGQARELVDPCYLLRHPRGDLLWDAGVPEVVAAMPQGLTGSVGGVTGHGRLPNAVSEGGRIPTGCALEAGRITRCA